MKWIILIGKDDFNINSIRNLQHYGVNKITDLNTNRLVVDYGDDHVFYEDVEDLINDYEIEDLKKIPFQNPRFIMMTYTTEKIMKQILCQDNFLRGIYVDNDSGKILPIEEFLILSKTD